MTFFWRSLEQETSSRMKPEGAAKTICLGELFSLNPMLMIFGAALLTAVGLLVFFASRRPAPS
jgi:hypothetical protein